MSVDILDLLLDDETPVKEKIIVKEVDETEADVELLLQEFTSSGDDVATKKAALKSLIKLLS